MGDAFKSNTWLLILDPEIRLWNEKLKRLRKNEKKQTITISIAAGNYNTEIIIDLINQTIQDFRSKYQESSIGFENLAYLQSIENKCKKYQFELCSKHDREHDFDVILRWVVPCRKLRWICRKHSNAVVWQVETQSKLTIFVARHDSCPEEVTLYHDCKRDRYCKRRIFSLTTCQLLRHVTLYWSAFVRYITKHFTHEYLCSLMFRTQKWRHSHF